MRRWTASPALDRLRWILDGIDGASGWSEQAAGALSPRFSELVAPETFVERTRARGPVYAPLTGDVLRVDAAQPLADNVAAALDYLGMPTIEVR